MIEGGFFIKKILYFIPAIVACLFYGFAISIGGIAPLAYVFCALLILSGIILCYNKWWGAFAGILMGIWLMTLDLKETGQIIRQWPVGLVFVIYFIICGFVVYKKNK